jgi:RHS repeat-associated protein
MERAGASYALLKDERGSIRAVVDVFTGVVAQALEYDAFGKVTADSNPGFQPFGFAGGMYDPDTGLTHFGAREYDAETGSFTRADPSGFAGGENRYAYAGGDPVNFVDPDGNFIAAVVVGAAVAGAEGGLENYVDEAVSQALDPDRTGYDCAAIRNAAGRGAIAGAVAGGVAAGAGAMAARPKEHGSYTNTHESGKKYHGKGSRSRSQESGRAQANKPGRPNDPHIATDWSPSPNERQSFKDEATRMGPDGVHSPENRANTYNKYNSPGYRYKKEDGD